MYLTLLQLTTRTRALWIALIYAFATSSWSLSSQGLWQSSMSEPLLALTLYLLVKARAQPRYVTYAGVPLALAVACRPTTAIFAAVFLIYIIRYYRLHTISFLVFPLTVASFLIAYNLYYFRNISGGYGGFLGLGSLRYPQPEVFLGLLVSPSRGILMYTPVFLFAGLGLACSLHRPLAPLLTYTAIG